MAQNWLPSRDATLLQFAINFSQKVNLSPASYGLSSADAAAVAGLLASYSASYSAATNPATRTKSAIVGKDVAKKALAAEIRVLAKRVQCNPAVGVQQRTDLGLPIAAAPSPIPAPAASPYCCSPLVNLKSIRGRSHAIRLADAAAPTRRAKPAGVHGAEIYSFVAAGPGDAPPENLENWRFEGLATRTEFRVA
jgi:hypothetical protein